MLQKYFITVQVIRKRHPKQNTKLITQRIGVTQMNALRFVSKTGEFMTFENVCTILKSSSSNLVENLFLSVPDKYERKRFYFFMINCLQSQWISWYLIKRWIYFAICWKVFWRRFDSEIQLKCWNQPFSLKWFESKWNLIFFSENDLTRTSGEQVGLRQNWWPSLLISCNPFTSWVTLRTVRYLRTNIRLLADEQINFLIIFNIIWSDSWEKKSENPQNKKKKHRRRKKPEINHWNHWNGSRAEDAIC